MNNHKVELYKGSFVVFIIRGFSIFFGYILSYLIASYYGAKGVGIFSISHTLLSISTLLSVLGLDIASVRLISKDKSAENVRSLYFKILQIVVPFSIFISIVLFFSSSLISDLLTDKQLIHSLKLVSFGVLPLSIIYIHSEGLRGLKEVKLYSFFKYAMIPFCSSIILFFIDKGEFENFHIPIFTYLVSIIITCLTSFYIWIYKNGFSKLNNSLISIKSLLNISIPILLTTSMFHIMNWTDTIILGFYNNSKDIGIYSICLKMAMSSSIVLFSINSIAAPKFSELYSSNKIIDFEKFVKLSSKMIFWLSLPLLLVIALKAEFLLNIFGLEFIEGKAALYVLLFGQLINVLCGPVGYILMMTNKQKILRNIIIVSALLNISLNILLIPVYGILGAAFATTASLILWNISSLIYVYKKYGFITINITK